MADTYNGYCVKCKEKRDFEGEVKVSDSGRRMAQGICPVCGTNRNLSGCTCTQAVVDERFAGLYKLMKEREN